MASEQHGQPARAAAGVGAALPWVLSLLWMVGISWLSSQPDASLPDFLGFAHHDKVQHVAFFVVLGVLLWWSFRVSRPMAGRALLSAIIVGGLFGASDEIHQRFVPTRQCELADWAADLVGVVVGSIAVSMIWQSSARRRKGVNHVTHR